MLGVTALESVGIEVDPRNQTLKRLPTTRLKTIGRAGIELTNCLERSEKLTLAQWRGIMATVLVRRLDDEVVRRLEQRAAGNNRSL